MKKIKLGIFTFDKAENCGAQLQLFSMYKYLQNIGEVYIINYHNKKTYIGDNPYHILRTKKLKYFKTNFKKDLRKHKAFKAFMRKNFKNYTRKHNLDIVINGSDQLINPILSNYDSHYMEGFAGLRGKILYGGSFGFFIPKSRVEYLFINNYLKDYSAYSFRENQPVEIFKNFLNDIEYTCVCDPAFFYTKDEWCSFLPISKSPNFKYCLIYYGDEKLFEFAIKYCEERKIKLISICPLISREKITNVIQGDEDPFHFINYIKNAEYVFSNSYHACVFSIIFNKPFFAFGNSRINYVNDYLDIKLTSDSKFIGHIKIDWEKVNGSVKKFANKSKQWLNEEINKLL